MDRGRASWTAPPAGTAWPGFDEACFMNMPPVHLKLNDIIAYPAGFVKASKGGNMFRPCFSYR